MPIEVTCSVCGQSHRVKDEMLGRKIRCKQCDEPIKVTDEPAPMPNRRSSRSSGTKAPKKQGLPAWIPVAAVVALLAVGGVIYAVVGRKPSQEMPQAGGQGPIPASPGSSSASPQSAPGDPLASFEKQMADAMKNLAKEWAAPDTSSLEPVSYVVVFSGLKGEREPTTKELKRLLSAAARAQLRTYKKIENGGSRSIVINGKAYDVIDAPLLYSEGPAPTAGDNYYFKVTPLPGNPDDVLKSLGFGTLESFDPQLRILRIRVDALPATQQRTTPTSDSAQPMPH